MTQFGGPELDEASRTLPRSLAQGLQITVEGVLTNGQSYEALKEDYGITITRAKRGCEPKDRVLWSLEEVNDETDATPAQMAAIVERMSDTKGLSTQTRDDIR